MNEKIIAYIKNEIIADTTYQITSKDLLLEEGIIDSLGMMKLILFLEKQYTKRVLPEDMTLDNFKTVEKIASYFSA